MVLLNDHESCQVNGTGIGVGKLVGCIIGGAVGGLIRGIPGGPIAMIGNAVLGAGLAAFGVAVNDAIEIHENKSDEIIYV